MTALENKKKYEAHELVTHRDLMLLIDEVSEFGEDWIECRVFHKQGCAFSNENGQTPTWVGLEYMCQAVAALAGTQRIAAGRAVTSGFIIGSRTFIARIPYFEKNQNIRVSIQEEMKNESSLGVYECRIYDNNDLELASAKIKAVMPEDPNTIINVNRR